MFAHAFKKKSRVLKICVGESKKFKDTVAISEFRWKKPRNLKTLIFHRYSHQRSFIFWVLQDMGLEFKNLWVMSMSHDYDVIIITSNTSGRKTYSRPHWIWDRKSHLDEFWYGYGILKSYFLEYRRCEKWFSEIWNQLHYGRYPERAQKVIEGDLSHDGICMWILRELKIRTV